MWRRTSTLDFDEETNLNFSFAAEHLSFIDEVDEFIDNNKIPGAMDVYRENMTMLNDTPPRQEFMRRTGYHTYDLVLML